MDGSITGNFNLSGFIDTGTGGDNVEVTQILQDGTKIATITVDNVPVDIYAPTPVTPPSVGYVDELTTEYKMQVGGVSVGLDVTPVNVPLVSYTDDTTDGEKVGTLRFGSQTFDVKQKPSKSAIDYSTTEQDTGLKWVDGKTIYQKTYTNVNLSNNQDVVLDSSVSTIQLISYDIDFCGIPNTLTKHIENTSDTLYIDSRGLVYYINRSTTWWNELNNANITVWYTKS